MTAYKKLQTDRFEQTLLAERSEDALYWKNFEYPVTIKEFTAIDYLDATQVEPYYICVSAGPKVEVYHQQTCQPWKRLSNFKTAAYGAGFRQDGQLLVAGSEEGLVKLYNYRMRQMLRVFEGHSGPVHRAKFIKGDPALVSFSDDKTLSLWDIAEESEIGKFRGHTDFVRAGDVSLASKHMVLSGSYDHTVRMWDTRTRMPVATVNHGSPVEAVLLYPSGSVFASAGGTEVKVWDVISGRLLCNITQHNKTVTCLAFASSYSRLMSGSIDRNIKVYNLTTYQTVHTMRMPYPVLSLAVVPNDLTVVAGMISGGSGILSFSNKCSRKPENETEGKSNTIFVVKNITKHLDDVQVIGEEAKQSMSRVDRLFRQFKHSEVLDLVLANKFPSQTVAALQELLRRNALHAAVSGRDAKDLTSLISFIQKNFRKPKYKQILIKTVHVLLDVYGDSLGDNAKLLNSLKTLQAEIENEIHLAEEYMSLQGVLQMFFAASGMHNTSSHPQHTSALLSKRDSSQSSIAVSSQKSMDHYTLVDVS